MNPLTTLRVALAGWLLDRSWSKSIGLAQRIAPSTATQIANRPRRPLPLPLPARSHLIYHQGMVDRLAAENSLRSLAAQLPPEDEVLFLDVGGTAGPGILSLLGPHEWLTYAACQARQAEQQSYTYGLNTAMAGLKAPLLFVWRTDYVYPRDLLANYLRALAAADFACPYEVLVGLPDIDSAFVLREAARLDPFDEAYWRPRAHRCSLYETQDPALFAIRRTLWDRIGGLNHQLWGYGWQFGEFAARVRAVCSAGRAVYFRSAPPLHQTHAGSQMHQPAERQAEVAAGNRRFLDFLGGERAFKVYRLKQHLPPLP